MQIVPNRIVAATQKSRDAVTVLRQSKSVISKAELYERSVLAGL